MPYILSPSRLSLIKNCPRCFWLHFNKGIKRPEGIFPSLPNGMDKILKAQFDAFRDKEQLPPELKDLGEDVKLYNNIFLVEAWRNFKRGIRWEDEHGNIFMGAVDNILKKKDKLIVLDYKTRGYPLNENTHQYYQDQMDIYNLLLRKNGYETEDYAYLLFYHPTKVSENGDIVFHTDLIKIEISIKNAEDIFKKALDVLKNEMPNAAKNCEFCKWAENILVSVKIDEEVN